MDKNSSILLAAVIIFLVVVAFGGNGTVDSILNFRAKPVSSQNSATVEVSSGWVGAENAPPATSPATENPAPVAVQMTPPEPQEPVMQTVKNLHAVE